MKKKIFIAGLFSILCFMFGLFSLTPNKNNYVWADTTPTYFSLSKYTKNIDENKNVTYTKIGEEINLLDAVVLQENQVLILKLGAPGVNDYSNYALTYYSMQISNNNQSVNISSDFIKSETNKAGDFDYIEIVLDPYDSTDSSSLKAEGRYDFSFNYMEFSETNFSHSTVRNFSFSFYMFKQSTYFIGTNPSVQYANVETFNSGTATSYSRQHQFYYDNIGDNNVLNLPTLAFDTNKFEVLISKQVYGLNAQTRIYLDENGKLCQTGNIVKIFQNENMAIITFNDIGEYQIYYTFVHKVGNEFETLNNLTASTRYEKLNIFGFQLYHQNINAENSDVKNEFKSFDEQNHLIADRQTDVTFLHINNDNVVLDSNYNLYVFNVNKYNYNFNSENLSCPSTNQPPVELKFNATIQNESYIYKLNSRENNYNLWTRENYTGSTISEVGTYVLQISYKSSLSYNQDKIYTQYFLFSISNSAPSYQILDENNNSLTSKYTNNVVFVKNDENSSNPFNSPTKLLVYSKLFSQAEYSNPIEILPGQSTSFNQDGNYKVEMNFGKNLKKSIVSYFTIDTNEISGITARYVTSDYGRMIKQGEVQFFTNQPFVLEWNEKLAFGNLTECYYKFFPITTDLTSFTSSELENYYAQGKFVPVKYQIEYSPDQNISKIPYSNTISSSNVSAENVLTEQGLYIFKINDQAGNEKYKAVVLDYSKPIVLQKITETGNFITDFSALNIVAEDTLMQWGKFKVLKFSNLNISNYKTSTWEPNNTLIPQIDSYLKYILSNFANSNMLTQENSWFKTISINGVSRLYLASKINTNQVRVQIGQNIYNIDQINYGGASIIDEYSLLINVADNQGNIYENSYTFYIKDEGCVNEDYATIHNIQVSTDISKTTVSFEQDGQKQGLTQHNYEIVDSNLSKKSLFYMPINYSLLQLQYLASPNQNSIELENISIKFYPFISDYLIYTGVTLNDFEIAQYSYYTLNEYISYTKGLNSYYDKTNFELTTGNYSLQYLLENEILKYSDFKKGTSLVLSKTPTEIEVYNYEKGINLGTLSQDLYSYDINSVYDSITKNYITQEGKYVITRKYRELDNTSQIVGSKYDFMTREITFFVDRQNLISSPIMCNLETNPNLPENYQFISRVGGEAFIRMLNDNEFAIDFNELYKAYNYQGVQTDLITTNKLPVKLYLPIFKFGEIVNDKFTTYSNMLFFDENVESYINTFEMSASIKHLSTGNTISSNFSITIENNPPTNSNVNFIALDNGKYLYLNGVLKNGYLDIATFSASGQYEITLSQNDKNIKGNKNLIVFYLTIINQAPNFTVQDENGVELNSNIDKSVYYTNGRKIILTWTDSANDYIAKIDKNNIVYYINGQRYIIPKNEITTTYLTNSVELNIENVAHGNEILISMQYEGDSSFYPSGSFSVTKSVIIDRVAPTQSLDKLFAKANENNIINAQNLREGHNQDLGYNRSTTNTSSIFYNFAFALDRNLFNQIIFDKTDKTEIYFKKVADKYTNASNAELDPSSSSALYQVKYSGAYIRYETINDIQKDELKEDTYYEIVEIDNAGNLTVYTIYLCDFEAQAQNDTQKEVINYTSNDKTLTYVIKEIVDSNYNVVLTAKNNLQINSIKILNYPWTIVNYNNNKYIFSPDLENGEVYKYFSTGELTKVNLKNELLFGINRFNYVLSINNLPKNNINLQLAVSNIELSHTLPNKFNESIEITPTFATSSTQIDWEKIKIWEFAPNGNNVWIEFTKGYNEPTGYSSSDAFNLAQMSMENNITSFKITSPKNGAYYRYIINDNFHTQTIINHLYGDEFIDTIINFDGNKEILTDEIYGTIHYVSNSEFAFNYYSSITNVNISIYKLDKNLNNFTLIGNYQPENLPSEYAKYLTYSNQSYTQIRMLKSENECLKFTITATPKINEGDESEIYNFIIYNILPEINLKGKNGQNLNGLLDNTINMTSDPVTLEYSNTENFFYPVQVYVQYENESILPVPSKTTFYKPGKYTIYMKYTNAMGIFDIQSKTFNISDATWQFYSVVQYDQTTKTYVEVEKTNSPYTLSSGNQTINSHFLVNTLDYKILVNDSQKIKYESIGEADVKNNIETFIYLVSNYKSNEPTINYFQAQIAISYIPKSDKLIDKFYYIDEAGNEKQLTYSEANYTVTKELENADSVIVSWNNYYKIAENKITTQIRYGESNQIISSENIIQKGNLNSITLNRSGLYYFTFTDLSGNTHKFDYNTQITNSTNTYEFTYLKNVLFTVNGEAPINYAIYNENVEIQIPSYSLAFYDANAKPTINVLKNGMVYEDYDVSTQTRTYTFADTGLYEITFSAKKNEKELREEKFYFQIIKENELFWAYDIEKYENYYVDKIIKNGIDVTDNFSTQELGELIYINYFDELTNQIVLKPRLKNILLSIYDEKTGVGNYEITIATQNALEQYFTFKIKLSTAIAPINISHEEGKSTTDVVTVTFNAINLYNAVGDCIVKIAYYDDIILNKEYFEEDGFQEIYEVPIERVGTFYVQVLSASNKLIFSQKVERKQPLDTVAWVLISVGIIVVIGLTVLFVLLRKKMKIR